MQSKKRAPQSLVVLWPLVLVGWWNTALDAANMCNWAHLADGPQSIARVIHQRHSKRTRMDSVQPLGFHLILLILLLLVSF